MNNEVKIINVLLVEDDEVDVEYVKEILSNQRNISFAVTAVSRLSEALSQFPHGSIDVLLVDLNLSDSRGLDTFLSLHATVPHIPIVVLTGSEDEALAISAVQKGAQDYLVKWDTKDKLLIRSIQYAIERHKLFLQIRASHEFNFYNVFNKNADGILVIDMEGRVIFANPTAEAMFDKGTGQLVGHLMGFPVVKNDKAEIDILRGNGETISVDMRMVEAEWESSPAFIASLRDVTETKQLMNEIYKLNRTLEQRVTEEVEKRRIHEHMLVQKSKMAVMGEMIHAIAHQWRQPLNSLSLIVQDIREAYDHEGLSDEYLTKTIADAMKQIEFMSHTVDDFRNFFIPNKRKVVFDVNLIIYELVNIIRDQFRTQSIKIKHVCQCPRHIMEIVACSTYKSCEYDMVNVNAYPNELKQVILNLMVNARDAIMYARRKDVLHKGEVGRIELDVARDGDKVKIHIKDNGGGIPDGVLSHLFEPFFTTKDVDGTGVGLYMSKMIIEKNMGGKLYAENIDNGAMFTIELAAVAS
ncbi:MAG: response regulator [Nitrospirae bacterium]|uniref:hybrid sensor histidine kinase/response regulator n=1 Tax=Candidatus Magnetobacterium casense TaxID=1455061 RepID=UPI0006991678|nr:hybrid sensor histidine kinase/response regulator [Candidatus Magnetobacterium casensis]MBF0336910.1 response regulator [Nitrospirota bacterium]